MTTEQLLLETWRQLPETMKQEVLDFAPFLKERRSHESKLAKPLTNTSQLSDKLQAIRNRIVESGLPLLTHEEIEQEVLERRGGHQG